MKNSRRTFLTTSGRLVIGAGLIGISSCGSSEEQKDTATEAAAKAATTTSGASPFFEISLAQWSLHRTFRKGDLDNLEFAAKAKNDFGISAIEYVNQFFMDKGSDKDYLGQMKQRAADNGVKSVLIMIDREGQLADPNDDARKEAVENHYKWVEAAKFLGCHSIRVNAATTEGTSAEDAAKAAVNGLGSLATFAKDFDINVIVENHGGYSSNAQWLAGVMSQINMDNCGTLPDFGNFCIKRGKDWSVCEEEYDRYKGITELMPFAKAVSAKSHDFDENGDETKSDFMRIMKIVKEAGYQGFVGIEYEGRNLAEDEGIMATKRLLEKIQKEIG